MSYVDCVDEQKKAKTYIAFFFGFLPFSFEVATSVVAFRFGIVWLTYRNDTKMIAAKRMERKNDQGILRRKLDIENDCRRPYKAVRCRLASTRSTSRATSEGSSGC